MEKFIKKISRESASAIFIIALVSFFVISTFFIGFNPVVFLFAIGISFFISLFYPRSGLYATLFLTFVFERFFTLQPIVWQGIEYKVYPLDFLLGGVILGTLVYILSGKIKPALQSVDFYLIGFMLLTAAYFLVGFLSDDFNFSLSFSSLKNYAFYSFVYFLVIFLLDKNIYLKRFFIFGFAGAVTISLFILFGLFSGEGAWTEYTPLSTEGSRILAFTHTFYIYLASVFLFVYMIYKRPKSLWPYALAIFWGIGIIGSMMRHLWISLFLSLLFIYFFLDRQKKISFRKIFFRYLLVGLVIAAFIYYFALLVPNSGISNTVSGINSAIWSRADSLVYFSTDESFSWRAVVWREALFQYKESPILGIGLGEYLSIEMDKYRDFVEVRNVHNSLLAILVQMGIFSILLLFLWAGGIFKGMSRIKEKTWLDVALISLAVGYISALMFQPYLETNLLGMFFWIIFGLMRIVYNNSYENTGNK